VQRAHGPAHLGVGAVEDLGVVLHDRRAFDPARLVALAARGQPDDQGGEERRAEAHGLMVTPLRVDDRGPAGVAAGGPVAYGHPVRKLLVTVLAVLVLGLGACGGDDEDGGEAATTATTPATQTTPTQTATTAAEKPVTLTVNGEERVVTLSRVNDAYCEKKTDVCSAIRGRNFAGLSAEGKRAVREARERKAAREAAEREAERQRELEQQQQQQEPQPVPQPQPQDEGTTTG
jgi:hypothetical protein